MTMLQCGLFELDLGRPRIMAVINLTPDSFSGDGHGHDLGPALAHAEQAIADGADILDIGGESSRPGAEPVGEQEELDRVMPLLERLKDFSLPVSIDTVKPRVMRETLAAGASMINDINAFREPGAPEAVAGSTAALCVMHMLGTPRTMQTDPRYDDVVTEVGDFLERQVARLREVGVASRRIVIDPGFGFGKTVDHNLALLRALERLTATGYPVLAGLSRKSLLGVLTGRPASERVIGSVTSALIAVQRGARIVRVHDVAATRDALKVWEAVAGQGGA
ncbi:MAG: dihydropteroate synthase [Rhodocyclaceae bacterium]